MTTQALINRLAYRLRMARAGSGKTLEATAEDVGKSTATVGRALADVRRIKISFLFDLCESWGADPGEILTAAIEDARVGRGAVP